MASCDEKKATREELLAKIEDNIATGEKNLDPFSAMLNIDILSANPQKASGVLHVTPVVLNPYGIVHGGCLLSLADTVAGHNLAAAGKLGVTLSNTTNFLNAASGKEIYCHSTIQKLGRKISVVYVEAKDEADTMIFNAFFTYSTIKEIKPHSI